jgi:hypothetical protein
LHTSISVTMSVSFCLSVCLHVTNNFRTTTWILIKSDLQSIPLNIIGTSHVWDFYGASSHNFRNIEVIVEYHTQIVTRHTLHNISPFSLEYNWVHLGY